MTASRWITLLTMLVSSVAAVMVVPEVRCMLGLPSTLPEGCRSRFARAQGVDSNLFLPAQAAPTATSSVEASILRIRARFNEIERQQAMGQYDSVRKEVAGFPGDSAYATIYFLAGEVPKIRLRVFTGDVRTSYQAYYDGGALAFVYRTSSRLLPSGPSEFEQQRFYFAGPSLVRWLNAAHREVSSGTAEYVDAEQRMRGLGERLLAGAGSGGRVIEF